MNKIQIKKMIAKQVKVIDKAGKDMAISRWERARAFAQIHSMIIWPKSPYVTFRDFVLAEFPDLLPGNVLLWVSNYNQLSKWYKWTEIQTIAKSLSYSRTVMAQQRWGTKKKTSVTNFIKIAKSINTYKSRPVIVSNPNRISLILPALYVDKFETLLVAHGYMVPKDRTAPKHGISDAMVKYLDTI
jgi:hypothetical protein